MEAILADLCSVEGVLGSLIMSQEGLIISQRFDSAKDPERTSALVSSLLNVLHRTSDELSLGVFESILIEAGKNLLFARVTPAGVLVVLSLRRANPGLVRVEMQLAAERLGAVSETL